MLFLGQTEDYSAEQLYEKSEEIARTFEYSFFFQDMLVKKHYI